jgi:hypothetical protein
VGHDDRPGYYVRPPLMNAHEARKTPLVTFASKAYELSFLVRNTWRTSQMLGTLVDKGLKEMNGI